MVVQPGGYTHSAVQPEPQAVQPGQHTLGGTALTCQYRSSPLAALTLVAASLWSAVAASASKLVPTANKPVT